jgi:site-specific DNA-methyltransferase (adenine-specific)
MQTQNGAGERSMTEGFPDTFQQNFHPTVKPIKLMQYLIKLVTPPNGIVLDPFMGSGSTGVAARSLDFKFIGCEMNDEYFEIASKRIEQANPKEQMSLEDDLQEL